MAVLGDMQLRAAGRGRMSFANTHFMNAHRFALLVHQIESAHAGDTIGPFYDEVPGNVVASVISATAALEAFVNEVTFEPAKHFAAQDPDLVASSLALVKRRPLLERVVFLSVLNGRPQSDFGRKPGQDIAVLVGLRNALVHFEPEWPDEQEAHAKLGKRLHRRFALSPFFDAAEPVFPRACLSYGCAKWATESARDFIIEYADTNGWSCGIRKLSSKLQLP